MIFTVFDLSLRQLLHRPVELVLTFCLPILFFSIFALIFGRGIGAGERREIKIVVVDRSGGEQGLNLIQILQEDDGLIFSKEVDSSLSIQQARELVQRGQAKAGVIIQSDSRAGHVSEMSTPPLSIELLTDASDQIAARYVESVILKALTVLDAGRSHISGSLTNPISGSRTDPPIGRELNSVTESAIGSSFSAKENFAKRVSRDESGSQVHEADEGEVRLFAAMPDQIVGNRTQDISDPKDVSLPTGRNLSGSWGHDLKVVNVMADGKANPVVSMYAAGIAVMFLLFGATAGGGVLLEERENQTLERLLSSHLTMDQLLLGKWFYITFVGVLQVSVMFAWANLVFSVDLLGHWDGFLMMTLATSLAVSGFGLFLATLCRSRGQLNGLSTIIVLTMSALGGSMVPRYLMNESLQRAGLLTFNAWAIDGYDKIFWRELPVNSLAPQLMVLTLSGVAFLLIARLLAVRWETS